MIDLNAAKTVLRRHGHFGDGHVFLGIQCGAMSDVAVVMCSCPTMAADGKRMPTAVISDGKEMCGARTCACTAAKMCEDCWRAVSIHGLHWLDKGERADAACPKPLCERRRGPDGDAHFGPCMRRNPETQDPEIIVQQPAGYESAAALREYRDATAYKMAALKMEPVVITKEMMERAHLDQGAFVMAKAEVSRIEREVDAAIQLREEKIARLERLVREGQELMAIPRVTVPAPDPPPGSCTACRIMHPPGLPTYIEYKHAGCLEHLRGVLAESEKQELAELAAKSKRLAHKIVEGGASAVAAVRASKGGAPTLFCQNEDDVP